MGSWAFTVSHLHVCHVMSLVFLRVTFGEGKEASSAIFNSYAEPIQRTLTIPNSLTAFDDILTRHLPKLPYLPFFGGFSV